MTWMEWYNSLAKPRWTPAPATINLIWTILYPILLVSFDFVFVRAVRGKVGWKVGLPFAINSWRTSCSCRSSPGYAAFRWRRATS